jgi:hypothetical protein
LQGQKLVVKQNYRPITNIDEGDWSFANELKRGDTVIFKSASKTRRDYYIVTRGVNTFFVLSSNLIEADAFFENEREKLEEQLKFILIKPPPFRGFVEYDTVKILDTRISGNTMVLISNGRVESYVNLNELQISEKFRKKIAEMAIEREKDIQEARDKVYAKRHEMLLKKYGKSIYERVMKGELWIGMTAEMAIDGIGKPQSVNTTVTQFGKSEQWVYEDRYLYFEKGNLTAWQTRQ